MLKRAVSTSKRLPVPAEHLMFMALSNKFGPLDVNGGDFGILAAHIHQNAAIFVDGPAPASFNLAMCRDGLHPLIRGREHNFPPVPSTAPLSGDKCFPAFFAPDSGRCPLFRFFLPGACGRRNPEFL
jgi:hypothetical protein